MARHGGKAMAAAAGLALVAASAAVAFASIPDYAIDDGATIAVLPHAPEGLLPLPVIGDELFLGATDVASNCMTDNDVVNRLDEERQQVGGETVVLAEGLDQAFADEWRRQTGAGPMAVSAVYAHVIGDGETGIVDVVEIDAQGCAVSRTLLDGADWQFLLVRAAGLEA